MTLISPVAAAPASASPQPPTELLRLVTASFEGFAGGDGHPCLGARSVVHRGSYRLRLYERLGTPPAGAALAADLADFGVRVRPLELCSFVAVFVTPGGTSEESFRDLLWEQLQLVHDADRRTHGWDPRVSSDPADPRFSLSVGGIAYYVVGLHAGASRWARHFAWPTLVFNPHEQFVALREAQRYDRMRSMIRGRDEHLQGGVNPVLSDHGAESEARQYAGDNLPDDWRCPLVVQPGT